MRLATVRQAPTHVCMRGMNSWSISHKFFLHRRNSLFQLLPSLPKSHPLLSSLPSLASRAIKMKLKRGSCSPCSESNCSNLVPYRNSFIEILSFIDTCTGYDICNSSDQFRSYDNTPV